MLQREGALVRLMGRQVPLAPETDFHSRTPQTWRLGPYPYPD